jgi:ribosome biogenesis GTPase A
LIVINRQDMISKADRTAWDQHFSVQAVAATAAAKAAADAAAQRKQQKLLQQQQQHLQEQATQVMSHDKYEPSNSSSASLLEHQVQQNHQHMQQQQQQQQELSPPSLPQQVFWTDGKTGAGVHALRRAALKISDYINEKRSRRGLAPRPVRACVIGFPNIGKSALINRWGGSTAMMRQR